MIAHHEIVRDGGDCPLTVVTPFTRPWAVKRFFDALDASDVPHEARFLAYVDSDDAELVDAIKARLTDWRGVTVHVSGWAPPDDNAKAHIRRKRHCAMRLALRGLMPKTGPVLMLEDDTLVPKDIYRRLTHAVIGAHFATGVQVGRWGVIRCTGLWRASKTGEGVVKLVAPPSGVGLETVDACGLYALYCQAEDYRALDFRTWDQGAGQDVSVTLAATRSGKRIVVDWGCGCGHLTQRGVIKPSSATPFERTVSMLTIQTPSGPLWVDIPPKEATVKANFYRTKQRIEVDGRVAVGKGTDIKLSEAVDYARRGLISDPALSAYLAPPKVAHVEETPVLSAEFSVAQYEKPMAKVEEVKADLDSLTIKQLKAMAESRGVDLDGATRKADIIARLR